MKFLGGLLVLLLGFGLLGSFVHGWSRGGHVEFPHLEGGSWNCGELCGYLPQPSASPLVSASPSSGSIKDLTCPPTRIVRRGIVKPWSGPQISYIDLVY